MDLMDRFRLWKRKAMQRSTWNHLHRALGLVGVLALVPGGCRIRAMPFRDSYRGALTLVIAAAITLGPALDARQQPRLSVQYRSPAGVEYRSLPDTDAVKTARAALDADPKSVSKLLDLGVAQSGARQFREAIATFTRGLEIEPNNALLLRWRGHRYLSVREFDRAFADLTRGGKIDPTIYGIWYRLGVVQFLRGDFADAAASFAKAQPIAPDAGELAGSTDWLWMSLSRAGRGAEAKAMLDRRPDEAGGQRVHTAAAAVSRRDRPGCRRHTGGYRRRPGRHARVRSRQLASRARRQGEGAPGVRAIDPGGGGWPGFGFIVSEVTAPASLRLFNG